MHISYNNIALCLCHTISRGWLLFAALVVAIFVCSVVVEQQTDQWLGVMPRVILLGGCC